METHSKKQKNWRPGLHIAVWIAAFIALLVAAALLFFNSYTQLGESLAAERTVYISELSKQLVDKINKMQEHLFEQARLYSELLQMDQPQTFGEAQALFASVEEAGTKRLFLVGEEGHVYGLDKKTEYLENVDLISSLLDERKQDQSFERNSIGEERWIFGCPIDCRIGARS